MCGGYTNLGSLMARRYVAVAVLGIMVSLMAYLIHTDDVGDLEALPGETGLPFKRPNFLLIQVDDLGYDDLGVHGNTLLETPNLDQLAGESVRFDNFYLSSVCAPSRAALLTGRNFLRTGVSGVHGGRDYINLGETLFSEVLQSNGYETAMWGKWHSGKTAGYLPWDRGFNEAYYASLYNYFDNQGLLNGREVSTQGFATDVITDFALDYIDSHASDDKPFLAYVAYMAPHNPWRAPQGFIDKYQAKGLSEPMSTLYGMIGNLDHNIGRLLAGLRDSGLDESTIVIFLSDNGPWTRSYRFGLTEHEWQLRNPNGRRGTKGDNWENGIRSPFFIRWKGVYEPKQSHALVKIEDIYPSLLQWAGVMPDPDAKLDGVSLISFLDETAHTHQTVVPPQTLVSAWASPLNPDEPQHEKDPTGFYRVLSDEYRGQIRYQDQRLAIRHGGYKYIRNESGNGETSLYDIRTDPQETQNLIAKRKTQAIQLEAQLRHWYAGILNEPHAHRMPVFQVGYEGRKSSQIYALAASAHGSTLHNHAHYLGGWQQVGDWASYDVNVHTPGIYAVDLVIKTRQPERLFFELTHGEARVESALTHRSPREIGTLIRNESFYWENFDLPHTFKTEIRSYELGSIFLAKGEDQLRLSLSHIADSAAMDPDIQMIAIQLTRQ